MNPEHSPSWLFAHQCFANGASEVEFFENQLVQLINNDFLLAIFLLSYIKLQLQPSDIERIIFLQDLQVKLAEHKTSEATEAKALLLWGFLIMSGGNILKRSEVSKNQLLILARYFQTNATQPEGWSDGLLGAIGLKRDCQSNKKKVLVRCFSCAIFALFTRAEDSSTSSEYENSLAELKSVLSNKKFADMRMVGLQATTLIENKKDTMLDKLNETISSLIKMFYQESFLETDYLYNW